MREDRVITLIDWHWQEASLDYSGPRSVLPTALNNHMHAGKHLLGKAWVKPDLQQVKPSVANR